MIIPDRLDYKFTIVGLASVNYVGNKTFWSMSMQHYVIDYFVV